MTDSAERIRMDAALHPNAICDERRGPVPMQGQNLTGNR